MDVPVAGGEEQDCLELCQDGADQGEDSRGGPQHVRSQAGVGGQGGVVAGQIVDPGNVEDGGEGRGQGGEGERGEELVQLEVDQVVYRAAGCVIGGEQRGQEGGVEAVQGFGVEGEVLRSVVGGGGARLCARSEASS